MIEKEFSLFSLHHNTSVFCFLYDLWTSGYTKFCPMVNESVMLSDDELTAAVATWEETSCGEKVKERSNWTDEERSVVRTRSRALTTIYLICFLYVFVSFSHNIPVGCDSKERKKNNGTKVETKSKE